MSNPGNPTVGGVHSPKPIGAIPAKPKPTPVKPAPKAKPKPRKGK